MTDSSREQAPVCGLCVYGKMSCKWGFAGHESTNVTIPGMLPARYVMISLVPCVRCPLSTIPCCTCVESSAERRDAQRDLAAGLLTADFFGPPRLERLVLTGMNVESTVERGDVGRAFERHRHIDSA
jgi:hypothetical protein